MTKPTTHKAATRAAIDHKPTNRELVATKLTYVQRIVLSDAALRADGAAAASERMTQKAVHNFAATLVAKGLVREVRAKAGMPVWRRNEQGRACALIVSKLGREAIQGRRWSSTEQRRCRCIRALVRLKRGVFSDSAPFSIRAERPA